MKQFYILIFILLNGCCEWIYADNSNKYIPKIDDVTLPSPTSQTYQRFMGYEPNLATGAINVTIPLYTLDSGSLSIPLALNYQSNGIKPTDPYIPLGYGWTLQPGLRITRTIIGNPDDVTLDREIDRHIDDLMSCETCYFDQMTRGLHFDNMNDIFTICLPTGNVSFILKYSGNYTDMQPWKAITLDSPLRIEVLQNRDIRFNKIHGFKVVDENGVIYYFGNEKGFVTGVQPYLEMSEGESPMPTTYLLRKIYLPGKGDIDFEWQPFHLYPFPYSSSYEKIIDYQYCSLATLPEIDEVVDFYTSGFTLANSTLKSISSKTCNIQFNYASGNKLENLVVYTNGKRVKLIEMEIEENLLQKIVINEQEIYSFDYDEKRFLYTRCCDDYWGYYNGRNNFRNYPSFVYHTPYNETKTRIMPGANKEPDSYYMNANLLRKITYPTGGNTTFEYEPNRILTFSCGGIQENKHNCLGGGLRVSKIISCSGMGDNQTIIKTYKYGNK